MSDKRKFYVKPAPGEHVETNITIEGDKKSSITATVTDTSGKPVEGAMAILYTAGAKGETGKFVASTYTDEDGQFAFFNLHGDVLYLIKVFIENKKKRELEIEV